MAEFAHESEAQVAGLLTGYGIRFEYEPTTFVLDTSDDRQAARLAGSDASSSFNGRLKRPLKR